MATTTPAPATTTTTVVATAVAAAAAREPPSLLLLSARALVGREAEVNAPDAVPGELVDYYKATTATYCPHCAHHQSADPRWPHCRFGHELDNHTTYTIALQGHTECMLATVRAGAQWRPETTSAAAEGGHTECMLEAVRAGARWHPETTYAAAWGDHTECLRAAHENGAVWHGHTTTVAAGVCRAYCRAHDPALVGDCGCTGRSVVA